MTTAKNIPSIMQKIVSGTAPDKFTSSHLQSIGFSSSNDRGIIPILKELGFLTDDGTPTPLYHEYRNPAKSRQVLGDALKDAYGDLFHVNAKPTEADRAAIEGVFRSKTNSEERIAQLQAMTFFSFLKLADIEHENTHSEPAAHPVPSASSNGSPYQPKDLDKNPEARKKLQLRYNIEIHLPATKEIDVYNAIFKALKDHLID